MDIAADLWQHGLDFITINENYSTAIKSNQSYNKYPGAPGPSQEWV